MRMRGHAQHDAAEYVPKEMRELWKRRDPLDLYEKVLTERKLWDTKTKKEIDQRISREIQADVEFAENSPFPPPEFAETGVYCDGCHVIEADWKRPKEEVMPPRSSVKPEWPRHSPALAAPPKSASKLSHAAPGNGARTASTEKSVPKPKAAKKLTRARVPVKAGR